MEGIGTKKHKNCKPVFCIDTGVVYASVSDAAEQLGIPKSTISYIATHKHPQKRGVKFCFVSEITDYLEEIASCSRERNNKIQAYDDYMNRQKTIVRLKEELKSQTDEANELRLRWAKIKKSIAKTEQEIEKLGNLY